MLFLQICRVTMPKEIIYATPIWTFRARARGRRIVVRWRMRDAFGVAGPISGGAILGSLYGVLQWFLWGMQVSEGAASRLCREAGSAARTWQRGSADTTDFWRGLDDETITSQYWR